MSQLAMFQSNHQFQTLAVSQLMTVFGSNLIIPVLPVYLKVQGFSDTQIGALMGIAALGALVLRPLCGRMVDQRGSRPVMLLGQLLTWLGVAAYFFATTFFSLLGLRFFQGIAMAFYGTAAVTFASCVETPENTAGAIALYTVFTMVGVSVATSGAPLLYDYIGFHALAALGLVTIALAAGVMLYRGRNIPPLAGAGRVPFMTVLRAKEVSAPTVCLFASNFACMTAFTFVPLAALAESMPFSLFFIGFMIAVVGARLAVQRLTSRAGAEILTAVSSFINVLGLAVVIAYVTPLTLFISGILIGIGFGLIFPIVAVYVVQHNSPANKGAALGILTGAGDIGNALGASVLGIVADLYGYRALFAAAAAVVMLCTWHFYVEIVAPIRNAVVSGRQER